MERAFDFTTTSMTFQANVPNGIYNVSLTSGDADYPQGPEGIFIGGNQVDTITTNTNQFVTDTYPVTVTNGSLDLMLQPLAGGTGNALINGLVVSNASSTATTYSLTAPKPATGSIGTASGAFTVALPTGQTVASPVTVTPNDGGAGGSFAPSSVVLSNANSTATFSYTAAKAGTITIATTNNGGLQNPAPVTFTAQIQNLVTDLHTLGTSFRHGRQRSHIHAHARNRFAHQSCPDSHRRPRHAAMATFSPTSITTDQHHAAPRRSPTRPHCMTCGTRHDEQRQSVQSRPVRLHRQLHGHDLFRDGAETGNRLHRNGFRSVHCCAADGPDGRLSGDGDSQRWRCWWLLAPSSVVLSNANSTATFSYTAAKAGTITIATTNNGGLQNPAPVTFTAQIQNLVTTYTLSGPAPARSPAQPHSCSRSEPVCSPILSRSHRRPRMGMGHSVPLRLH